MSDTVAAIEAEVTSEITQTQGVVDGVTEQISDLLDKLNSLSHTMFIPKSPDLSALVYPGSTKSGIDMKAPTPPSSLDHPPQADTSVTYLPDYSGQIDTSILESAKSAFIQKAMAGMINPASINVKFVYRDPFATTVNGDGGSPVILLIQAKALAGMTGYLVLDDSWAQNSFDAGTARDAVDLEKAAVAVQRKWSALGYNRAPGMVAREITDANQKYLDVKLKQSRDLGIKQYDTSFAFRQAMIASAASIAGIALSHANNIQTRALDALKSVAKFTIDQYNLLVARWDNTVEIAKLPVDVAIENLSLKVKKTTLEASAATEDYLLEALRFERETQNYKAALQSYRDTLRQFSHQLGLAETNNRVALMNDSITLKEAEVQARVSLERARMALHAFAETMSSEIHAIAAGGKVYSGAIASANNAIATLVTLQNSGEMDSTSSS